MLFQQPRPADLQRAAPTSRLHAPARQRLEVLRGRQRRRRMSAACWAASRDACAIWVLAVALDGGSQRQRLCSSKHADRRNSDQALLAHGQRAGLVEDHHVEVAGCSSARRSRTRMPLRADRVVEIAITSGIARPSAWGQATTRVVTTRSRV